MVVPRLYQDEMAEISAIPQVRSWTDEMGMAAAARTLIDVPDGATVAIDPLLHASFLFLLEEQLPGRNFVSAESLLTNLRLHKDEYEKECLRRAARMADNVIAEVTSHPLTGRTEAAVAADIERLFKEQGSQGVSFPPIVSAGANAAFPHHMPDETVIQAGDGVVLDIGGVYEGYASDITRTVFAGEPSADMKRIYEIVRQAQEKACQGLTVGMEAQQADAIARSSIEGAGHGRDFIHRLGHGIGLDVHESPYLVTGNAQKLDPGVAFSVEPGVYITGLGGVRIEDIVVMNEDGPERLNHAPRELRTAGG